MLIIALRYYKKMDKIIENYSSQLKKYVYGQGSTDDNEIKCEFCGTMIEKGSLFCKFCGKTITTTNIQNGIDFSQNNEVDGLNLTRNELFKRYMPEITVKAFSTIMIIRYIVYGLNLFLDIINENYDLGIIELLVLIGVTLGMQLKISKLCAIIDVVCSIITLVIGLVTQGVPIGILYVLMSSYPLLCIIDFDKILAKKLK